MIVHTSSDSVLCTCMKAGTGGLLKILFVWFRERTQRLASTELTYVCAQRGEPLDGDQPPTFRLCAESELDDDPSMSVGDGKELKMREAFARLNQMVKPSQALFVS